MSRWQERSNDSRWQTKFGRFVSDFGADALAARLLVKDSAVYQWVSGATTPRPERALQIQSLAERADLCLSVSDIYEQRRAKRKAAA